MITVQVSDVTECSATPGHQLHQQIGNRSFGICVSPLIDHKLAALFRYHRLLLEVYSIFLDLVQLCCVEVPEVGSRKFTIEVH